MKLEDMPTPETDAFLMAQPLTADFTKLEDQYGELSDLCAHLEKQLRAVRAVATMEAYAVCAEICQEESTDNGTAQKIEARIRALKERK